ncbi:MAG: bifunctional phosphoribosyl-AMP cyclohydrolase/phosphoribosyl-ATP diphosphatase HisIE [Bacteroidetes bacterium]|nr:bifunctional phosphoribosyl-AMP cyclohydrolase/phosphoribosyl-ATP diphosphatase HisIE [Bacteroidota bacterium]
MNYPEIEKLDFSKLNGLLPAVITDIRTGQVLMLGFMNQESYKKTIESGKVTFFSRAKCKLWTKGETSGHYLYLKEIKSDCDNDTLLIKALPEGNTCHLDAYSCFAEERKISMDFLLELNELICDRKIKLPENSYTTTLFKSGENRIIQKVGEEAIETVIAAKNNNKVELINEVSDLLFHLLVLLTEKDISIMDVVNNLENRHKK